MASELAIALEILAVVPERDVLERLGSGLLGLGSEEFNFALEPGAFLVGFALEIGEQVEQRAVCSDAVFVCGRVTLCKCLCKCLCSGGYPRTRVVGVPPTPGGG